MRRKSRQQIERELNEIEDPTPPDVLTLGDVYEWIHHLMDHGTGAGRPMEYLGTRTSTGVRRSRTFRRALPKNSPNLPM